MYMYNCLNTTLQWDIKEREKVTSTDASVESSLDEIRDKHNSIVLEILDLYKNLTRL